MNWNRDKKTVNDKESNRTTEQVIRINHKQSSFPPVANERLATKKLLPENLSYLKLSHHFRKYCFLCLKYQFD